MRYSPGCMCVMVHVYHIFVSASGSCELLWCVVFRGAGVFCVFLLFPAPPYPFSPLAGAARPPPPHPLPHENDATISHIESISGGNMACTPVLASRVRKSMSRPAAQEALPVAKAPGLSRFYKAKSQSFRSISEAMNTEFGESAWGLAKRVKLWHTGEEQAQTAACVCERKKREWSAELACTELMGLSVREGGEEEEEEVVFRIGSKSLYTSGPTSQGLARSRKRDRGVTGKVRRNVNVDKGLISPPRWLGTEDGSRNCARMNKEMGRITVTMDR